MTPEEFRKLGHLLVDWIADYRSNIEKYPVRPQIKPGDVRKSFPSTPPERQAGNLEMIRMLEEKIMPGMTHVQHPMYYGWFPSNAALSSVLGDLASSGLAGLGISWESCPSLTEVEELVCDWMRQLTGLSDKWVGCIHDTASTACLTSLIVARERATNLSQNRDGLQGEKQPLTVYTTEHSHSSVQKAALLSGFGFNNIRYIETDPDTFEMQPQALARAIQKDLDGGCMPAVIVATSGSTGVLSFDPLEEIAKLAKQHNIWLHVDAAMAGSALILPECRHLMRGIELADAISWNPHKWFGAQTDCSLMYVQDTNMLKSVMSTNPSYLQSVAGTETTQLRDWTIPLGRRFRALKLLFMLEIDGIEQVRTLMRRDMQNARWLAGQVTDTANWKVVAPVTLQMVCIRHEPEGLTGDDLDNHTLDWAHAINDSGKALITPSILNGQWMVRVSIGAIMTAREHVEDLWKIIQKAAGESLGKSSPC
ncbi:MAG: aspartate aminotransferase family protein [Gammaproteobacteria bacterium]|nr:aspartate aminotransferase family protein [Gammaproteobacteria bacterium]